MLSVLLVLLLTFIWYTHNLDRLILGAALVASHIDSALLILLALDLIFLFVAEVLVRVVQR